MTRAEIEAAIASVSSEATSRAATDPLFAAGMHHAARMLREALAKSEAASTERAPDDGRKVVRVSAAFLADMSAPLSGPHPISGAGPGLWRVIAVAQVPALNAYDLDVVPDLMPPVPPAMVCRVVVDGRECGKHKHRAGSLDCGGHVPSGGYRDAEDDDAYGSGGNP